MSGCGALSALLALALTAVLAPAPARGSACPEDGADVCCTPCAAHCSCCATPPPMVPTLNAAAAPFTLDSGRVAPDLPAAPPTPWPRKILHVPKPAAFRA